MHFLFRSFRAVRREVATAVEVQAREDRYLLPLEVLPVMVEHRQIVVVWTVVAVEVVVAVELVASLQDKLLAEREVMVQTPVSGRAAVLLLLVQMVVLA